MPTPAEYLALAHAEEDVVVLQRLAQCPYPFVWQALAANPHTPPVALQELSTARDSVWNDNELPRLLAEHPGADLVVLRAVLDAVAAKLEEGERPYAAVLALADRPERAEKARDPPWGLCPSTPPPPAYPAPERPHLSLATVR